MEQQCMLMKEDYKTGRIHSATMNQSKIPYKPETL